MKKLSFGVRLALWYAVVFALAELVFGVSSWLILRQGVYDIVDDNLQGRIDELRGFLEAQKKDGTLAELRQQVTANFAITHSGDFLQLHLETGELIYRSTFLESHPSILIPPNEIRRPIFRSRLAEGRPLRFIYQRLQVNGHVFIIEMGTRAEGAVQALSSYRLCLMIFAPLLLVVVAGIGFGMNRSALGLVDDSGN